MKSRIWIWCHTESENHGGWVNTQECPNDTEYLLKSKVKELIELYCDCCEAHRDNDTSALIKVKTTIAALEKELGLDKEE